jgi:hypothetical protein
MSNENNNKTEEGVSPKLLSLAKHISDWLDQYTDEEFDKGHGVSVLLMAFDKDVENSRLLYTLYDKADPQGDMIRAIDHGIAGFLKNDEDDNTRDTRTVFNAISEFMALIFAKYPAVYEKFDTYVQHYRQNMYDSATEGKTGIII